MARAAQSAMLYHIYPALHWAVEQLMMLLALNVAFAKPLSVYEYRTLMYGLGAAYILSLAISTHSSWQLIELRLGGKARMILREEIIGTVMRLTEDEIERNPTGKVVAIAVDTVEQAIRRCWLGVFMLWEKTVFLLVMITYTAYVTTKQPFLILIPIIQALTQHSPAQTRAHLNPNPNPNSDTNSNWNSPQSNPRRQSPAPLAARL